MNRTEPSLRDPAGPTCPSNGIPGQFAHPRGPVGALVGHVMAIKNHRMARFAIDALDLAPDARVLEIGFGPGAAIRMAARRTPRGSVAGVDLSETMVRQATRRNHRYVRRGRVDLRRADASTLPFDDRSFDRVFAINVVQFWPDPLAALYEIRRVLRPEGTLVLTLRLTHPARKVQLAPGFSPDQVERLDSVLLAAGFGDPVRLRRSVGLRDAVCLIARR